MSQESKLKDEEHLEYWFREKAVSDYFVRCSKTYLPHGWRWLSPGEVTREGDVWQDSRDSVEHPQWAGEIVTGYKHPTRRKIKLKTFKFEVSVDLESHTPFKFMEMS